MFNGILIEKDEAGYRASYQSLSEEILPAGDVTVAVQWSSLNYKDGLALTAYKCGFKVKEVPVIFINRELGTSKMNSSIFGEAVFGVIRLKWNSWFHKYPTVDKEMK